MPILDATSIPTPADYDLVRDQIAALLTQNSGEYVFRIGQEPPHAELFSGELNEDSADWSGSSRSVEEIGKLYEQLSKVVEEVGGKVGQIPNILAASTMVNAKCVRYLRCLK